MTIDINNLRSMFSYDGATGVLTRRSTNRPTGSVARNGYLLTKVNGVTLYVHRIAWVLAHGESAPHRIDHINGTKIDNRLANLRPATDALNSQNVTRPQSSNRAGYRGVCWDATRMRWRAEIRLDGHTRHLGRFATRCQAHVAYVNAKRELHPFWVEPVHHLAEPASEVRFY